MIPVFERQKTKRALDRAIIGIGEFLAYILTLNAHLPYGLFP